MKHILSRALLLFTVFCLLAGCIHISTVDSYAAIKATSFKTEDYEDLLVDNSSSVPDYCYAKFTATTKNIDYYTLYLEEEDEEYNNFTEAVSKLTGIKEPYVMCFNPTLMFYDEDKEDADDVQKYNALTLLVPLPDDYQETPEKVYTYEVSSKSGKYQAAIYGNGTLYKDEDDIYYTCINLSNSTSYSHIYGFAYDEDALYEDEDEDEDEDEYEDEDEDITPVPKATATPTPTPTPKPTPKPTTAPKATATPTPKSGSGSSGSGSSGSNAKDSIPKTGDNFPLEILLTLSGIAGIGLAASMLSLIKKKK